MSDSHSTCACTSKHHPAPRPPHQFAVRRSDLEHAEGTCGELDIVAAAADMRTAIRGDETDLLSKR